MIKYIFFVAAAISSTVATAQMPDPKSALSYTDTVQCHAYAVWYTTMCQSSKESERFCPIGAEATVSSKSLAYEKGGVNGKDIGKVNKDIGASIQALTSDLLATDGAAQYELTKAITTKFLRECAGKGLVSESTIRRVAERK